MAQSSDVSNIAESIRVKAGADSSLHRPSLMDRIKQGIGLRVERGRQAAEEEKKGEEIEMLDEQGHI